jgi:SAM-dependent methyltransferase
MVRTVRSIEEEARVKLGGDAGVDGCLADPVLLDALEGKTIADLVAWAVDGTRRALVVGLEDRGRIALKLAEAGLFVTVVEPDESLHEAVRKAADAGRFGIRMNFYASDYMKREFQTSGFDVAVFFSALNRYNEPVVVLKKAARELRAGGRVFARVRVRPSLGIARAVAAKLPGVAPHLEKVRGLLSRVKPIGRALAIPDSAAFVAGVEEAFKVEKVVRYHVAAPAVAAMGARGSRQARDALGRALAADRAIVKSKVGSLLATHLALYAVRELQLGKTFRV